jgi:NAD(P)-dependent dehydrogenase (short-subunit alcohol dehydrogenase family)
MKSLREKTAVVIGASSGVGLATVKRLVSEGASVVAVARGREGLDAGSTVAIVSSGAAVAGSPLSGGYAGAKRMQWFMVEYAQEVSDAKKLGIRFFAVLPRQLIEGTEIGATAAANYGAAQGLSAAEFLKRRWKVPLDVDKVGAAIVSGLRGDLADGVAAIGVTGEGVEPLG